MLSNASTAATAKSGYFFLATPAASGGRNIGYTAGGSPASANQTGVRGFCSNEDGVIRSTPYGCGSRDHQCGMRGLHRSAIV